MGIRDTSNLAINMVDLGQGDRKGRPYISLESCQSTSNLAINMVE